MAGIIGYLLSHTLRKIMSIANYDSYDYTLKNLTHELLMLITNNNYRTLLISFIYPIYMKWSLISHTISN